MEILLCTIGFAGKSAEEFFGLLQSAGVQEVIDIRQNRGGQLSGFAKHPDLKYFLERLVGMAYVHEPELAPTPELLKKYRSDKDWAEYETEFRRLLSSRGIPEKLKAVEWPSRVALLCSEATPEKCHRRIVAELMAAQWRVEGHSVEIRHLVGERAKGEQRGRAKRKRKV